MIQSPNLIRSLNHQVGEKVKYNFRQQGDLLFRQSGANYWQMSNRIKEIRETRGLTLQKLQELTGISLQQLSRLELGQRRINEDNLQLLARAFGTSPSEILGAKDEAIRISVIGYVGAGEKFEPIDDFAKGDGLEDLDMPLLVRRDINPHELVAVKVRGDSMRPLIRDGWVLFYTKPHDGVPTSCLRELCIVKLKNGEMYVKEIRKGEKEGYYTLVSYNNAHAPIENAKVDWAAKVISFQPPR